MKNFRSLLLLNLLVNFATTYASQDNNTKFLHRILTNYSAEQIQTLLKNSDLQEFANHTNIVNDLRGPKTGSNYHVAISVAEATMVVKRKYTHHQLWDNNTSWKLYNALLSKNDNNPNDYADVFDFLSRTMYPYTGLSEKK